MICLNNLKIFSCICLFVVTFLIATPVSGRDSTLPIPTRIVLDNGLTVLILPQNQLPLVATRLVLRTGSAEDSLNKEGLAAFTAMLLKKGAGNRTAVEIADAIEFHGGRILVDYSHDATVVSGNFLSRDILISLTLLADIVTRPTFTTEEITRTRQQRLAAIAQSRENAGYLINAFYQRFLYKSHPYSRPLIGTTASINSITRSDIVSFHQKYYVPNNAYLVIVGDIQPEEVIKQVKRLFEKWIPHPVTRSNYPQIAARASRQVWIVDKPDISQAHIRIGTFGIPRNHPDYIPLLIANTILGRGGFTSRLVDEIRVNQGLTYNIDSQFTTQIDLGTFTISTFTRTETAGVLLKAIFDQLESFRNEGVKDGEIAAAKQYLAGVFPLSLEGPKSLAAQFAGIELFGLPDDTIQTYKQQIQSVSSADIKRVVNQYFTTETMAVVIMGNADRLAPQVKGFGPIEQIGFRE